MEQPSTMLFRSGVIKPHVFNTLRRVEQELLSRPSTSDLWNRDGLNVHARSHLRYVSRLRSFCLYNLRSHCAGPIQVLRVAIRKKFRTTKLRVHESTSLLFGAWSKEYGMIYEIPMMCGQKRDRALRPGTLG